MGVGVPAMTWLFRIVVAFLTVKLVTLGINLRRFAVLRPTRQPMRPSVSLLIPMRNESARLAETLPAAATQDVAQLIVLNDRSTDDSAELARGILAETPHASVVTGRPTPAGWTGKTWACTQLADLATGDLLVFCDSDTALRRGAVCSALAEMEHQDADVFSVFPRQMTETLGEQLLVPLIDDALLCFLPFPLLSRDVPATATANGSLIAMSRTVYDKLGGFATVRSELADDVALARHARRNGLRLGLALGGDLVQIRMYRGYRAAVAGFGRTLLSAFSGSRARLALGAVAQLTAYALPLPLALRRRRWTLVVALGLLERLLVEAKTGRRQWWQAVLVPLSPVAAIPVVGQAMRQSQPWRGRVYR